MAELDHHLGADSFRRLALPYEAGFVAGRAFMEYRRRGGLRTSPLPDFYIGAHAAVAGLKLLTRDARRYTGYFPKARARGRLLAQIFLGPSIGLLMSGAAAGAETVHATSSETIEETTCRIVESAAHSAHLPVDLLTRLVWIESRFQAGMVSSAGAQGVAQFMPQTAAERGLADPFDPEQAIPMAAKFLVDLEQQFGNIGLATAAYNAGPTRVASWLAGSGDLPRQTQVYVFLLTGRTAENWAARGRDATPADETVDRRSCIDVTATLRLEEGAEQAAVAPWGVQLAGNFSKATALASFERARQRYSRILGDLQAMIIGTRLRSRGTRPFYRVLVPASSRAEADQVCRAIMMAGGACVALRS